ESALPSHLLEQAGVHAQVQHQGEAEGAVHDARDAPQGVQQVPDCVLCPPVPDQVHVAGSHG
ncbi:hypothetical protein, partial [Citrobacter youngae]|uniref:hypothetical protein n=1 Tax=Citrobacter youngae TaxID=133448 RepID=UPI001953EC4F